MDELDRILSEDEGLEPSLGFTERVMDAVQEERPEPIAFPWARFVPAVIAALVILVGFPMFITREALMNSPQIDYSQWLEHPLAMPLGIACAAMVGSWFVMRMSMRMAGGAR